ncbi:MAG: single-stranded DNA-binding protein [Clostridiales bacterium]|nr:single-stranded DNA-binding protein [Clostridiales bacterium]
MRSEEHENRAMLRGRVAEAPVFSHQNHGEDYLVFPLAVPRLSGTEDILNVVAPAQLMAMCPLSPGDWVQAEGEVRSFNNKGGSGNRLVITFFTRSLEPGMGEPLNQVLLAGALCKAPILRRTPLGRDICDLLLAVNRRYGRTDYLPCIAWGSVASACGALEVGELIRLEGRLQSREYRKLVDGRSETRTAFEVSVMRFAL